MGDWYVLQSFALSSIQDMKDCERLDTVVGALNLFKVCMQKTTHFTEDGLEQNHWLIHT